MKLNMHLIEHELRGQLNNSSVIGHLNSDYRIANLDYPLLLESLEDCKENIVYVSSEGQMKSLLKQCEPTLISTLFSRPFFCICVGKPPEQILMNQWSDCIWIESQITRSSLLNEVQELFQRLTQWEWQLEQIVSNFGSITDLVMASLPIVKNDIWINDQFCKILVHRIYKNIRRTKAQLDEIQEGEMLPKNMIEDGNEEELVGKDFGDTEPTFSRMQAYNHITLSCCIHAYSDYYMTLAFHPNYRDVLESDCILMRTLAHYIELAYSRGNFLDTKEQESDPRHMLITALDNKHMTGKIPSQLIDVLNWKNVTDTFVCLCCDFSFERRIYDSCFIRSHSSTCSRIQQKYSCLAVPYKERIVVLTNLTKSKLSEQEFLEDFSDTATSFDLSVGSSAAFNRLQELSGRYLQASIALEHTHTDKRTVRFEDHLLEYAVDCITSTIPPEFLCPKELYSLYRYDETHGTMLTETLRTYIDCNCSATAASNELFIVRSSFIYRLKKIEKELGLNLEDPDVRLLLSLSFRILERYRSEDAGVKEH